MKFEQRQIFWRAICSLFFLSYTVYQAVAICYVPEEQILLYYGCALFGCFLSWVYLTALLLSIRMYRLPDTKLRAFFFHRMAPGWEQKAIRAYLRSHDTHTLRRLERDAETQITGWSRLSLFSFWACGNCAIRQAIGKNPYKL